MKFLKIILISLLLVTASCGKEKKDTNNLAVGKGSGQLVLNNSEEVIAFKTEYDTATIDERVLLGTPPAEVYTLKIEDIERGDYLGFVEVEIGSWLSEQQKETVISSGGCIEINFYDSEYFPEIKNDAGEVVREEFFKLGDLSVKETSCR